MKKNSMIRSLFVVSVLILSVFLSKGSFAAEWYCTAFTLNEHGYIGTAGHCVKGAKKIFIKYGNNTYPAKVIEADYEHDVAIVKIDAFTPDYYNIQLNAKEGEKIFILGYPIPQIRGYNLKMSTGHIQEDADIDYMQLAGSCHGNSGGPVINEKNQVIGVLVAGTTMAQFGAESCSLESVSKKIKWIVKLADKNGVLLHYDIGEDVNTSNVLQIDENKTLFFTGEGNYEE